MPKGRVELSVDQLNGRDWKHVAITITSAGRLTVQHPAFGTTTVDIPEWDPQPSWRFGLSGRTIVAFECHWIKNLEIYDTTRHSETAAGTSAGDGAEPRRLVTSIQDNGR